MGPITTNGIYQLTKRDDCPTYSDFFNKRVKLSVDTLKASFRKKMLN